MEQQQMEDVEVVSVDADGYYTGEHTSGSTVKVMLRRSSDYATCRGILIWDEEWLLEDGGHDLFDEWVGYAKQGVEGYSAVVVEGDRTVLYGEQQEQEE